MKAKTIFLSLFFIPFLGFSQSQEDTLELDSTMFVLPSSFENFQLIKGKEELDKSLLDVSFTPAKSVNIGAIRSGILEAQLNYYRVMDTSVIDSTGLSNELALISPDQTELNSLLRIGEWTESMFLLSKYVLKDRNMTVASRIINQKTSVDLILRKLVEMNDTTHLSEITTSFQELQTIYGDIKRKYKSKKPKVDKKTNTTTFYNKTIVKNVRKSFIQIEEQLNKMRFQILNYTENQ